MRRERPVIICEVSPRDGFQNEPKEIATAQKVEFINKLSRVGFSRIEVSSFVSPAAIPQLRDADEVFRQIDRAPAACYVALVPNSRGAERAIAARVDELNFVVSVSEAHNRANMRMPRDRSVVEMRHVADLLKGTPIRLNATAATAFACPFEGYQPIDKAIALVEQLLNAGATSITLADTIGAADPRRVGALIEQIYIRFDKISLTLHCHDTRGMALANLLCAYELGVVSFDTALGGIGGCPFAPGATGNVCTEDVVHMFECMGVGTGLNFNALIGASNSLEEMLGYEVPGRIKRTKPSWECGVAKHAAHE